MERIGSITLFEDEPIGDMTNFNKFVKEMSTAPRNRDKNAEQINKMLCLGK